MTTVRGALELARTALIGGKAEAALGPCQGVLERFPKHVEATCLLAETRRELRQLPQAADLFELVLAADPESLIAHWGMATILEELGDLPAALYELECAWDAAPGQAAVREELVRLRVAAGWGGEQAGREPELGPIGLARVYWRGFQYRRAVAELRRAVTQRPDRLDARVLLAECLWRMGRAEEAGEVAAEALAQSPDCLKANLIRGYARLRVGGRAVDEARKLLQRALALDPECASVAGLFPNEGVPLPLVPGEVALDGPAPELVLSAPAPAVAVVTPPPAPAARGSLFAAVADVAPAPVAAPVVVSAPALVAPTTPVAQPVIAAVAAEVAAPASAEMRPTPGMEVPPARPWTADATGPAPLEISVVEAVAPGPAGDPTRVDVAVEPEAPAVPVQEEEPGAPVPAWLVREESPVEGNGEAIHGLDPSLYAEWADLLGEEVALDADAEARLQEALAEATGANTSAGAWREVVLGDAARSQDAEADLTEDAPAATPAPLPMESAPPPAPAQSLEDRLTGLKATGASGQIDAAAEGYRALLRECADAAQPALADLSVLVASHPDHAGLRRALGDAYMRCGRFQKAIEEYNRAVAAQQPVAAA